MGTNGNAVSKLLFDVASAQMILFPPFRSISIEICTLSLGGVRCDAGATSKGADMSNLAVPLAVLALLAAPTIASTKDRVEPRMAAMLACGSVASNEARLACYDQAATSMRQALDQGDLVLEEKSRPKGFEGVVKTSTPMGGNRHLVVLDSGDRWQVISTSSSEPAPLAGARVKVRKGAFGNYWLSDPNSTGRRAIYQGRSH